MEGGYVKAEEVTGSIDVCDSESRVFVSWDDS